MKLLLRCLMAAVIFSTVVGLASILTFNGLLAILGWPGLVATEKIYAGLGIYADNSKSLLPWLIPGLVIDVAIYTIIFFMLAKLWEILSPKSDDSRRTL